MIQRKHAQTRACTFAAACLCWMGLPLAHAQAVSVYGTFSPTHISNVRTGFTSGGNTPVYTGFWAPAFGGGVTVNFLNLHVVKLGVDVRGSTKPGTTGADTAQLALLLGFQPPVLRLKPYVQGGVGYLATRTANQSTVAGTNAPIGGTFNNQYLTAGFQAGLDKPLIPFLDFRIVEVGYTRGFGVSPSSSSANSANTFSISTGLVAHF